MRDLMRLTEAANPLANVDPQKIAQLKADGFDVKEALYHGSQADFDVFDMKRLKTADHLYTSPDPNTAHGYGDHLYICLGIQDPQADLIDDYRLIGKLAQTFANEYYDAIETDEDLAALKQELVDGLLEQHADDPAYEEWDAEQDAEQTDSFKLLRHRTAVAYVGDLITSGDAYGVKGTFQNSLMRECFGNGYRSVRFADPSLHDTGGEWVSVVFNHASDVVIVGKIQ